MFRDVTNHAHRPRLLKIMVLMSTEKIYTFGKERENSLLVSNSAHTSFYTVKLKHEHEQEDKHMYYRRGTLIKRCC